MLLAAAEIEQPPTRLAAAHRTNPVVLSTSKPATSYGMTPDDDQPSDYLMPISTRLAAAHRTIPVVLSTFKPATSYGMTLDDGHETIAHEPSEYLTPISTSIATYGVVEDDDYRGSMTQETAMGKPHGTTDPTSVEDDGKVHDATILSTASDEVSPTQPANEAEEDETYGEMEPDAALTGADEAYEMPADDQRPPAPHFAAPDADEADNLYGEFELAPATAQTTQVAPQAPAQGAEDEDELYGVMEPSVPPPPIFQTTGGRTIVLDRRGGKKIGMSLQDAATGGYMTVKSVNPGSQAYGKVRAGEDILSVNGVSSRGMAMKAAGAIIVKGTTLTLVMKEAAIPPQIKEKPAAQEPTSTSTRRSLSIGSKPAALNSDAPAQRRSLSLISRSATQQVTISTGRTVQLDRSRGEKIGMSLQDAPSEGYMTVKTVNPGSQADGIVMIGETIVTINGVSTIGMTMRVAGGVIMKSTTLELVMASSPVLEVSASAGAGLSAAGGNVNNGRKVELHRGEGKKIGVRLQDAVGPGTFMTVKSTNPGSQADGKLTAGELILSINGSSTKGMRTQTAGEIIMKSATLVFIIATVPLSEGIVGTGSGATA
jgi:hypothetical protein